MFVKSNVLSEEQSDESKDYNMYIVYVLRFSDNSLYIGQTNNLEQRIKDHSNKKERASKFSKEHDAFKLVYQEEYNSRLDSMRREKQLKGWTRAKKEALAAGNKALLKKL
jgi:predicted GIY-YIG superfamily endonuclease